MRNEALRLRREERLSLTAIAATLGVSKATLSLWVRSDPLTSAELAQRYRNGAHRSPGPPKKPRGEESQVHRAVGEQNFTSNEKGQIAEAAVLFRLVVRRFTVFRSVFDGANVDFIVRPPNSRKILRLQVRWAKHDRVGLPRVKLLCSNGRKKYRRYTDDEFDAIVGYDFYADTAYVFPRASVAHVRAFVTTAEQYAELWDALLDC